MKLLEITTRQKDELKKYDVETPYDWFYDYLLGYTLSHQVTKSYQNWKKKNPTMHPKYFIEWLRHNPSKFGGVKFDLEELDGVEKLAKFTDGKWSYDGILDMREFNSPEELEKLKPPFKFHFVSTFEAPRNWLSEYPDWFPEHCDNMNLAYNDFKSLSSLKRLKSCKHLDLSGNDIRRDVLSLLLIDGLEKLTYNVQYLGKDVIKPLVIVKRFIKNQQSGNKAVLAAQSEMLDLGFEKAANL